MRLLRELFQSVSEPVFESTTIFHHSNRRLALALARALTMSSSCRGSKALLFQRAARKRTRTVARSFVGGTSFAGERNQSAETTHTPPIMKSAKEAPSHLKYVLSPTSVRRNKIPIARIVMPIPIIASADIEGLRAGI